LKLLKSHNNHPVAFKQIAKPHGANTQTKAWQRPFRTGELPTPIKQKLTKFDKENKGKHTVMHKNNSRESRLFKVCNPLQVHRNLKDKCSEIGNFSYTHVVCNAIKN